MCISVLFHKQATVYLATMKECFISRKFNKKSRGLIQTCNDIIVEYQNQNLQLTLRQLYYQLVARDFIPNNQREYNLLAVLVNNARLAGEIDWDAIIDRTRELRKLATWGHPKEIIDACARQFKLDRWSTQPLRPEVWIEKDALLGVIENVCNKLRVPYFSCRGYTSQSEMYVASKRILGYSSAGQKPIIFHLGDHDPSGIDMTRDITERLTLLTDGVFSGTDIHRLALNMDQVNQYNPPPNPTKLTDSRSTSYIDEHGNYSWELDALDPKVLSNLIEDNVLPLIERGVWDDSNGDEKLHRKHLRSIAEKWDKISKTI